MSTQRQTEQRTVVSSERLSTSSEVHDLRITLTRLETKLDLALVQHGSAIDDHERRLREVESRPYVTPKGLMVAMGSTVAILGGFITFLDRLYA